MKGTILIVDDEKHLLMALKKYLTSEGYDITTCDNGADGIKEAKQKKYDLVITDIKMPEMGGVDVIKNIEKLDAKVKFLIITAYTITGEITDLIERSKRVHGYIFKPFEMAHLQEKIEQTLRHQ